jgi:hypothetical protein
MSLATEQHSMRNPRAALHWYDFLCPFCYRTEPKRGPGGQKDSPLRNEGSRRKATLITRTF